MFKFNTGNTRKMCKICSKFNKVSQILHILVFLLLNLNEVNAGSVNVAQINFPVSNTSYNGNMFSTTVSIITKKVLFRVFYFPLIAAANAQEGIRVISIKLL